ncbi:MAG: mechanosensitive ion channel [Proteobacteria bacterium]|nr:mechanosensitive ion channel [Pseudomonadota bacterium]
MIENIQVWVDLNPTLAPWALSGAAIILSLIAFLIARYFVARGLVYLAERTESKYDDIVVEKLRPFRFAWIAPLLLVYYFADLLPETAILVRQVVLFLILWVIVITLNSLLDAVNAIYEASDSYRGLSIQGYLDLGKILLILTGIVLTASLFTGKSPVVLMSGLGALMALLLLLFRDTLLSFVASIQIQSNDLVKEGDWIEMSSFGADGDVINIALHTVKIQNWDKTITVIPTYKLLDTPFKNWRGMQESGGRRIKRAIHLDLNSIRFCDQGMLERFSKIDLIKDHIENKLTAIEQWNQEHDVSPATPFNGRQITNVGVFQAYVVNYLKSRPDLHHEGMTSLVRQLAPALTGLPMEIYVFTKTVVWMEYEAVQADIFDHLIAAVPQFDLRVFQQPTGGDFRVLSQHDANN